MRRNLLFELTLAVSLLLVGATGAQAVVVDMNPGASGQSSVTYPADPGDYFGVALVPGTREDLKTAGIPTVHTNGLCEDPALAPDLKRPDVLKGGICSHGGPVMHANETFFALIWDPERRYFSGTKGYVEQFLRDVADGSGTLTSPYAVTTQYTDGSGRAGNASLYGGACDDFGIPGGSACEFPSGPGAGHKYPQPNGCPVSGINHFYAPEPEPEPKPELEDGANDVCLTDAQIKSELATMVAQTGILGRTELGYTPTLVLLTPPGVETCLDAAGKLCSAATGSAATAQFCSYHSQVNVGGAEVHYVVQPWTAQTACDEPGVPTLPNPEIEPHAFEVDLGMRLVSPLSQAQIAAVVNPELNGWFALDGSEINDNGCVPRGPLYDSVTVGESSQNPYLLQREFNNGGLLVTDPYAHRCTPSVVLEPKFVVPSPIDHGNVVEFDGSVSPSTLVVPAAGYAWELGDGTKAVGPSVEHTYAKGGTYSVKLTLTDRGGYVRSTTETVDVIGPPVNTTVPTISDLTSLSPANVVSGDKLEVSTGSWSGYPTPVYAYQWQDCNAVGESCTAINGATAATYTPVAADVGHTLRVELTAGNAVGSGKATSAQTAVVNAGSGQLSTSPLAPGGSIASTGTAGSFAGLKVKLQLVPESLKSLLHSGVALVATANEVADGIASISITPSEAKRAHIPHRPSQSVVVIGRGTVKGLVNGADHLHLRLSKQIAAKLKRLRRVVLTIQVKVVDSRGESQTVSATGRY